MKKILIVDDEPDLVFSIKCGLECFSGKYKAIGVKSGYECFDLLNNGMTPDLIILDIMMPKMNGWNIVTKLKENPEWREIPVVFLTAKTDPYSRGFGKIPVTDYIEKPCNIKNLEKRIDRILKKLAVI